jgi:hypothetical protein
MNRARGELGLVAFYRAIPNTAIVNLGQAIKLAETIGDTSSLIRWLRLFGHGYVELGRPEQAFDFLLEMHGRVPRSARPDAGNLADIIDRNNGTALRRDFCFTAPRSKQGPRFTVRGNGFRTIDLERLLAEHRTRGCMMP